ncbi:hypothetical protein SMICM17S_11715 [Streptomyces microflavus]
MLSHPSQPNGTSVADYYRTPVTNHGPRVVHANSPIGYAFPYDDVAPDGEPDVSALGARPATRRSTLSAPASAWPPGRPGQPPGRRRQGTGMARPTRPPGPRHTIQLYTIRRIL